MAVADITADISIAGDVTPNLNMKMHVVRVTCTENSDWIEMSTSPYDYTTVYAAIALVSNASEACEISDSTKITFSAGGTDTITLLIVGV